MKGEARVVGEGTMRQQRGGWGNNGVCGGRGGGPYALLCRRGVERFGMYRIYWNVPYILYFKAYLFQSIYATVYWNIQRIFYFKVYVNVYWNVPYILYFKEPKIVF